MAEQKFKIKTYNNIARVGLDKFGGSYDISESHQSPDVVMLRSFDLHKEPIADSVLAVGRAGAGVNNIPVEELTKRGVVVFNAPGANANSVKELVVAGMLLAGRNIAGALKYTSKLSSDNMKEEVEAGKKKFAGGELSGKTLGVIGLGAIGYRIANTGVDLGMKVIGYDPVMTIQNAMQLSSAVQKTEDIEQLLAQADYTTIHVPLLDSTKGMIDIEKINLLKKDSVLVNFSRDELVDEKAVIKRLDSENLRYYVTDFPNAVTSGHPKVIALPHLGASTEEAEDNCAVMVAESLRDYLENGNINYSVNYPTAVLNRKGKSRIVLVHENKPGVVAQISNILGTRKINIVELLNKSRGEFAYTIIDLEQANLSDEIKKELVSIPQLLKLRVL